MSIPIRIRQFIRVAEKAWRKGAGLSPGKGKCSFCCKRSPESGPLAYGKMGDLICFDCAAETFGIIADEIEKRGLLPNGGEITETQRRRVSLQRAAEAANHAMKSFSEIVAILTSAKVDYYFVDYVSMRINFYAGGDAVMCPLAYNDMPPISSVFAAEPLAGAISGRDANDSHEKISRALVEAGVVGYLVFLSGIITFFGRSGEQFNETFTG